MTLKQSQHGSLLPKEVLEPLAWMDGSTDPPCTERIGQFAARGCVPRAWELQELGKASGGNKNLWMCWASPQPWGVCAISREFVPGFWSDGSRGCPGSQGCCRHWKGLWGFPKTFSCHVRPSLQPFVPTGGSVAGATPGDPELFVRWLQIVTFLPVMAFGTPPWLCCDAWVRIPHSRHEDTGILTWPMPPKAMEGLAGLSWQLLSSALLWSGNKSIINGLRFKYQWI